MELLILFLLLTKHTIADYFLQYSWMIKDKGSYGKWGGIAHAGLHGLFTLFVLTTCGTGLLLSLLMGLLDSFIHYHVDYVKSNFWKEKKLTSADQLYWITHGIDQFAHVLTYFLIVILI